MYFDWTPSQATNIISLYTYIKIKQNNQYIWTKNGCFTGTACQHSGNKKRPPFCCPKPEVLSGALPAERLVALEGEELASEEVKDKRRLGKKLRAWNHEIEMGVS